MVRNLIKRGYKILDIIHRAHTSAYASQSAYFFMLSLIPMLLLLLTMIQFTPVTKADVMVMAVQIFPKSVTSFVIIIIDQVYNQSRAIIPVTSLIALWSAGRGVLAMSEGLNCVFKNNETRNYVIIRIRSAFYTLLFIAIIILLLVLSVFGNSLSTFFYIHAEWLSRIMDGLLQMRAILTVPVLIIFSMLIYKFLPNHKVTYRSQLPGAIFTAFGWMLASYVFSVYLDIFRGFSDMYGSLTTIILIMLWLNFNMYVMLLGGIINFLFAKQS